MENIAHLFYNYFTKAGMSELWARYLNMIAILIISLIIIFVIDLIINKILLNIFNKIAEKTKSNFDNLLVKNNVFKKISHIVPFYIALQLIPIIFTDFDSFEVTISIIVRIVYVLLIILVIKSVLNSTKDYFRTLPRLKDKPIESFIQVIMIFVWIGGLLSIIAGINGAEIWKFFTALGAASAVLLLVFKDTILGFVASIQVSINDMVRIGDWITFDKYGADGNVTEINLATVKVQNFDKTITTIPTYALISDSFKNWRGMENSGGRRIKRAVIIKLNSVKYLSKDELIKLKQIELLSAYLKNRSEDIDKYNTNNNINKDLLINGRNLTNIGVFRKYVETYIENHSGVNKDMMIMTRQLAPTTQGLPIEIYAFSSDKRWQNYEYIMADIFDHIIAAVPYFGLEIFELPTDLIPLSDTNLMK
ncbi:MAG: mechanosensitive ion channel family protein [Bacteroidetes bacterium]|nr:MAG: mechanosensitive ion channel family protein [Bacteroidota bacterium]